MNPSERTSRLPCGGANVCLGILEQSVPITTALQYVCTRRAVLRVLLIMITLVRRSIREREVPILGFCFSFPVEQSAVDAGKLLRWTKGYNNPGAVGKDPAKLLAEAFKRQVALLQRH